RIKLQETCSPLQVNLFSDLEEIFGFLNNSYPYEHEKKPDLILISPDFPLMTALKLFEFRQSHSSIRNIPVAGLSKYDDLQSVLSIGEFGSLYSIYEEKILQGLRLLHDFLCHHTHEEHGLRRLH
ncbi:MAG: hypothetical protein ACR2OW_07460, partial [Methyloligellaceae bacterium]